MIELFAFLLVKHFIVDFPLQADPYMYKNKGIYGHPGGILHASLHAIGTVIVMYNYAGVLAFLLGLLDGIIHYHIDWAKMKASSKLKLTPDKELFWVVLGFDQLLHHLTYFAIIKLYLSV